MFLMKTDLRLYGSTFPLCMSGLPKSTVRFCLAIAWVSRDFPEGKSDCICLLIILYAE